MNSQSLDVESLIGRVADQFLDDVKQGKAPSIEGYARRHGEIADVIRQVFPALLMLEQAPTASAPSPDLTGSQNGDLSPSSAPGAPPRQLGDFRLLRELGRGGMGVVYEAEQISLGRRVALKVLPFAAMLDQQQLARFKNEARAAATLDHPHIVSIYSVGSEQGIHYYAMQLVEGGSLAQLLSPGGDATTSPLPTGSHSQGNGEADTQTEPVAAPPTLPDFSSASYYQTIARLGMQAASALDHAHTAGILHRDIKPANLLVDTSGQLLVADFGLARIESDVTLTATGDLLGTLRYMSPEQLEGNSAVVDHRSDIYSLGATLYELATRQPLYKGNDRTRLMADISRGEPTPPRKINRRIPLDLETIILKAIEREPTQRYATAKAFADDLQRFLQSQPIAARPASLLQRASKWSRRHRTATLVTSVAAVLLLMFASAVVADRWRQVREGSKYVEQSLAAAWEALEQNDVPHARRRISEAATRIDANRITGSALNRRVSELEQETIRYLQFMKLFDEARRVRSESKKALTRYAEALELYGVMSSPNWLADLEKLDLPASHVDRIKSAVYELLLGKADELTRWDASRTPETIAEAIVCLKTSVTFHPPSKGYYWLMANCAFFNGDLDACDELRTKAQDIPPDHAAEMFYINRDRCWGTASPYKGYPIFPMDECYKHFRDMLRFDPQYYNAMFFMASRFEVAKRHEEAIVAWNACISMRPTDWVALARRSRCYFYLGHNEEGISDLQRVLEGNRSAASNTLVVSIMDRSARIMAVGPDDSLLNAPRALELAEQACQATDYTVAEYLDTLAAAHAANGDFVAAVEWVTKAIDLALEEADRKEYEHHLQAYQNQKLWRQEATPKVSAGTCVMVAEHLQSIGEFEAAAILFADALQRIPVYTPEKDARGHHGDIDSLASSSDEVFERLSDLLPTDRSLHATRAKHLISHGRWREVHPVIKRYAEIDPDNYLSWHEASAVAYYIGDMEWYESLCQHHLERLKNSRDPLALERIAKSCCLTPNPPQVELVEQLAERAIEIGGPDVPRSWFGLTAALAHYRVGDYAAALKRADESLAAADHRYCTPTTMLVKAMALHQLGQAEAATDLFAQACRLEAKSRLQFNGHYTWDWADWLRLDILRREAEGLFGPAP